MYTVVMLVLIGLGCWLAVIGWKSRSKITAFAGGVIAVGTAALFWFMGFWGEVLWFDALGFQHRFWAVFWAQVLAGVGVAAFSAAFVYLLTLGYSKQKKALRYVAILLAALLGLNRGMVNWENILRFLHAASADLQDPVFGQTAAFYFFTLPLQNSVANLLLLLSLISLAATAADVYLEFNDGNVVQLELSGSSDRAAAVYRAVGVLLMVKAYAMFLERYHLMYSDAGPITGPGWTDVHIRLPAMIFMIVVMVLAAAIVSIDPLRRVLTARFSREKKTDRRYHAVLLAGVAITVFALQAVSLYIVPFAFQRLRVEPNEITFEKPYIAHNIEFTRHGFNLEKVEEKEYPVDNRFTADMVDKNRGIFSNIRLWDWRALDQVFKQFQEIRLYYEFQDVDVDRYMLDGDYRQVMVSAREMQLNNLPEQSQTFVNRRFKYTHGYGITMTNVSEFTDEGLPNLLIRDIPPKSRYDEIIVERPEIYYGELTDTPVLVNTSEQEIDYPKGEKNSYIRYPGQGGVVLKSLWRKFLYGWKFDGLRLFLSEYPTRESRIMFHREIKERLLTLAPFLEFDDDPYIVLADGKLYWMVDCYTTSKYYPYSERFSPERSVDSAQSAGNLSGTFREQKLNRFRGSNYVRNSVKAVIDAFNGSVDFYVFDEEDPLIRTWQNIFPEMFKHRETMPKSLQKHIRYPIDMLLLQGLVYAKYHMTDPAVFYNQEDLWVRATEKYYSAVQPVEPYYIMWELPELDHQEFVLMMPFTPKNRQISIGWIAGMCDNDNYGRFLAYKFPKEKRVLGPQQVETKIDQDRFLSGQLSLWDQRGSRVIRGNVLAIPLEKTLLYVEPIYLQAETAAYPELRLVAIMHDDKLSYAESFDKALNGLLDGKGSQPAGSGFAEKTAQSAGELIRSANESFKGYLNAMGQKRFQEASDALQRLESQLQELSRRWKDDAKNDPK